MIDRRGVLIGVKTLLCDRVHSNFIRQWGWGGGGSASKGNGRGGGGEGGAKKC